MFGTTTRKTSADDAAQSVAHVMAVAKEAGRSIGIDIGMPRGAFTPTNPQPAVSFALHMSRVCYGVTGGEDLRAKMIEALEGLKGQITALQQAIELS